MIRSKSSVCRYLKISWELLNKVVKRYLILVILSGKIKKSFKISKTKVVRWIIYHNWQTLELTIKQLYCKGLCINDFIIKGEREGEVTKKDYTLMKYGRLWGGVLLGRTGEGLILLEFMAKTARIGIRKGDYNKWKSVPYVRDPYMLSSFLDLMVYRTFLHLSFT